MPKQLEPVDIPYALLYLWGWFCELSNGRQYSEAGAMPLTYSEMDAWARLTGSGPTAWEITVIKKLDREYLTEINKK